MPDQPTQAARLLFLHAQTALHPGSGTALGTVDLPVQRERTTGYPIIPGTALKGVLRDLCREAIKGDFVDDGDDVPEKQRRSARRKADEQHPTLTAAFGPATGENKEGNAYAGALSITDARLLAFPVRSARGVFAWTCCPNVVRRLNADRVLAGGTNGLAVEDLPENKAWFQADGPLAIEKKLVLEEFDFEHGGAEAVSAWVAANAVDEATGKRVKSHFALLNDNDFGHFARHATEVVARVGLDYDTKTVKGGALFYQEFIPAETIFYALVLANPSRKDQRSADEMLSFLEGAVNAKRVIQIGGDETTGKGYCFARLGKGDRS